MFISVNDVNALEQRSLLRRAMTIDPIRCELGVGLPGKFADDIPAQGFTAGLPTKLGESGRIHGTLAHVAQMVERRGQSFRRTISPSTDEKGQTLDNGIGRWFDHVGNRSGQRHPCGLAHEYREFVTNRLREVLQPFLDRLDPTAAPLRAVDRWLSRGADNRRGPQLPIAFEIPPQIEQLDISQRWNGLSTASRLNQLLGSIPANLASKPSKAFSVSMCIGPIGLDWAERSKKPDEGETDIIEGILFIIQHDQANG